jgi:hypothetical protein
VRLNWDIPRIGFLDWVEQQGNLDYYLDLHPELRGELQEKQARRSLVERLAALSGGIDPGWLAFMDTLGGPFHPFFFWNNTGPCSFGPGEAPFLEQIGTRGAVVTFQSSFRGDGAWHPGLLDDLAFLRRLRLRVCYYGAASCPVHPFICEVRTGQRPMTGADVIRALKAREFRSEHIRTLDATTVPFPGYHPGTDNDEIHNDLADQYIFPHPGEGWDGRRRFGWSLPTRRHLRGASGPCCRRTDMVRAAPQPNPQSNRGPRASCLGCLVCRRAVA